MERIKPIIDQRVAAYENEERARLIRLKQKEEQRKRYQQPHELPSKHFGISDQDHNNNLQSIKLLQDQPSNTQAISSQDLPRPPVSNHQVPEYTYPSLQYTSSYRKDGLTPANVHPPSLPIKGAPPLPSKPNIISDVLTPFNVQKPLSPQAPPSQLHTSPAKTQEFPSKNTTEGGTPLRTVFLPEGLRSKFLSIALPNTNKNLETCGMLCGKLQHNAFFITHLAIPHQISTSDTCSTTHEELLFNYLDENDLFILGWIHTHPTQSCFLSSVDLHTQNSYQIMLPESIAVVCAPRHEPAWGVFRLTDPSGVNIIKHCHRTGFHPHPEPDLYKSAHNPGHIMIRSDIPFSIEDLRLIEPED